MKASGRSPADAVRLEVQVAADTARRGAGWPSLVAGAVPILRLAADLGADPAAAAAGRAMLADCARALADAGVSPDLCRAAHYVVAALLDDRLAAAGADDAGLVAATHGDVGGDGVFLLIEHVCSEPAARRDLMLLLDLCLSLGFEGPFRNASGGALKLAEARAALHSALRGEEEALAPHWRGVDAPFRPQRVGRRIFTLGAGVIAVLVLADIVAGFVVGQRAEVTLALLAQTAVDRPATQPPPPALVPPSAPDPALAPAPAADPFAAVADVVRADAAAGILTLIRGERGLVLRIASSTLFDPGAADVARRFDPVIDRIGAAVARGALVAQVTSHTADREIATVRFSTNLDLSQARADAVAGILARHVAEARLRSEGRAEREPLAGNDTAEGREANRRTEILVLPAPPSPQ